nr:pseudouridine synthase [Microvirga brassicacearum]
MEPIEDRIAKVIARAGIASRRDVEAMIAEGRVTLNGKVLESPAINVTPSDQITVDGEPLPMKERTRLWLYHKPRGLVTTARDPEGRPTVFDNLPEDLPRVVAIGRLDINTEGLLLLTNDGGLARVIAHPNTGWLRRYKVRAHGEVNQADLDNLRHGVTVDGMEYGPIEARLDRVQGDNAWISLGLREGKNREVKRILEHLGLQVNRLIRLSFGPFQLGELEEGMVEEVKTKILRDQLGDALSKEAGVDFESPVREPIAPFGTPAKDDRPDRGDARPDRAARPSRDRNEDRPHRPREGDRGEERPRYSRSEGDRPTRGRGDDRRGAEEEAPRKRPSRLEPKTSIWRASDSDEAMSKKSPRRGADPRAARAVAAERPRQRAGAIESAEGRKVKVERLVSAPRDEEAPRKPRRDPFRAAPAGDDRPRRRPERDDSPPRRERESSLGRPPRRDDDRPARPSGDRPFRARPEGSERPRPPQGERPFRARSDEGERPRAPRGDRPSGDRPFRARPEGDARPRKPQGERPFRARSEAGDRPTGDRPFRARPEGGERPRAPQGERPFGERPRSPRPQGDRPFRAGGDDRPRRGPPRGDGAQRSGPRGGAKGGPGGGFKSGPRGGFKGGPKGGPKGRRP